MKNTIMAVREKKVGTLKALKTFCVLDQQFKVFENVRG